MLISRKYLIRTLVVFSFFFLFSAQAAEEGKVEDPSAGLVSQLGGMSLGERREMSAGVPPVKIEFVPPSFKTIEFDVSFKGGKARVRPYTLKDINKTWIERICGHDPTDPMDNSDPQAPLPSQEEVIDSISQILAPECPSGQYGIYDYADGQIMGMFSLLPGRHFYNAIESTIRVHRDFRGRGIATCVIKEMLETTRRLGCVEPIFYIEASINADNEGSIKSHVAAGMIPFDQGNSGLYYYSLREGLEKPIKILPDPSNAPKDKGEG